MTQKSRKLAYHSVLLCLLRTVRYLFTVANLRNINARFWAISDTAYHECGNKHVKQKRLNTKISSISDSDLLQAILLLRYNQVWHRQRRPHAIIRKEKNA